MPGRHFFMLRAILTAWILGGFIASCQAQRVDFASDVFPILETYCVGCHTEDDAQGDLVMESFAGLVRGGESGPALTPGAASSSRMFLMASGKLDPVMPPDDAEGPNEEELEMLARWIDQGAKGPSGPLPIKRSLRAPKISTSESAPTPITAIAVSPKGTHQASGRFRKVMIENNQGDTIQIDDPELGKVNSISFSLDGKRLLVASGLTGAYGRATSYDVTTGELIQEFLGDAKSGHRDTLYAAEFSPDGDLVATAGYDKAIVLWDAKTGNRFDEWLVITVRSLISPSRPMARS